MQYTLTCPNGKKIDFTEYILRQMKGELTRNDIKAIIAYYQCENLD